MVLPTIDVGVSYNWHQGRLQSAQGVVQDVSRQSLYAGAGAFAVGAGTVAIPGLRATAHLADAWFAPAAARQAVAGADFTAQAVRNDVLLEVAVRYFDLVGAEARVEALRQSEREFAAAAKLTADVARTGQGREADARRAEADALLLHVQTVQAEEATATAAADLARLLSRDPACRLRPGEAVVVPVHLVPPEVPLAELVRTALQNRPEVAAAVAAIGVGEARWQQECVRPFLPLVAVGFSAGRFGGGSDQEDTRFGHFHGRTDFDVLAVWSLDGLGFGNWAAARRWRAVAAEAAAERVRVEDRISAEVAEAVAQSAARREALAVAQRQAARAATAYQEDLARARNLEGRPIELLNSLNLLATARQELIRAVSGYNQAQFRLFVALGRPATLAGGATP
jgi:outer membrane protein TolC